MGLGLDTPPRARAHQPFSQPDKLKAMDLVWVGGLWVETQRTWQTPEAEADVCADQRIINSLPRSGEPCRRYGTEPVFLDNRPAGLESGDRSM